MLVDLLMLIPAAFAGVGGAFLGDKLGLWIKNARTTGES
jgi:hypothetical protein